MAKTNTAPEHTITREVDVKRRKVITRIAFPASEHVDQFGQTAQYGIEITTEYLPGLYGNAYESSVRDMTLIADGTVRHFAPPLYGNTIPSGGRTYVHVARYSRQHLEEVADAFGAYITSAPSLAALERWAVRHSDHIAKYGHQHFTRYQLSQLSELA